MGRPEGIQTGIASMTGYGRASGESSAGHLTVEVRSLNHRYLEVAVRAPKTVMFLEPEIRALVRERVSRGKVELFISLDNRGSDFTVDSQRADEIVRALQGIAEIVGDKVRLEHILAAGDIVLVNESEITADLARTIIQTVVDAIAGMVDHRSTEGEALSGDLGSRIGNLSLMVTEIEGLASEVPHRARQQIENFLNGMNLKGPVDPQRLEVEIAFLAQKSDVSEEITRLVAHLTAFSNALSSGGAVGRRMDFLLQEIQREVNTIGSKSAHPVISKLVVDFKTGLEKVREQVQNIE